MILYVSVISIFILCELIFLWYSYKRCGLTVFNIFYFCMIILLFCGALSACLFDSIGMTSYVFERHGIQVLQLILGDQMVFALIATVFLLMQAQNKYSRLESICPSPQVERYANFLGLCVLGFWGVLLLNINLTEAPLLNIGRYSYTEMLNARRNLYGSVDSLAVLRYLSLYMIIPCIFLLKGMGCRVYTWMLPAFMIISVLTLSKTAFVMNVFMYFIGRYLQTKSIRTFFWMILCEVIGFYILVAAAYWVDVRRDFFDVTLVLMRRFIEIPISLSANYAQIFNFDEGLRQSIYYVLVFGGNKISISQLAGFRLFGDVAVQATTGIVGMAYPNVPPSLHYLYYVFFVLLVYFSSVITSYIREYSYTAVIIKSTLIVTLGNISGMIFMTDPLTVMNSYGFMWLTLLSCIFYRYSCSKNRSKFNHNIQKIENIK